MTTPRCSSPSSDEEENNNEKEDPMNNPSKSKKSGQLKYCFGLKQINEGSIPPDTTLAAMSSLWKKKLNRMGWKRYSPALADWGFIPASLAYLGCRLVTRYGTHLIHFAEGWEGLREMRRLHGDLCTFTPEPTAEMLAEYGKKSGGSDAGRVNGVVNRRSAEEKTNVDGAGRTSATPSDRETEAQLSSPGAGAARDEAGVSTSIETHGSSGGGGGRDEARASTSTELVGANPSRPCHGAVVDNSGVDNSDHDDKVAGAAEAEESDNDDDDEENNMGVAALLARRAPAPTQMPSPARRVSESVSLLPSRFSPRVRKPPDWLHSQSSSKSKKTKMSSKPSSNQAGCTVYLDSDDDDDDKGDDDDDDYDSKEEEDNNKAAVSSLDTEWTDRIRNIECTLFGREQSLSDVPPSTHGSRRVTPQSESKHGIPDRMAILEASYLRESDDGADRTPSERLEVLEEMVLGARRGGLVGRVERLEGIS